MLAGALPDIEPCDRCFKYYHGMMKQWNEKPTWTTADEIYKQVKAPEYHGTWLENERNQRAKELAWQVFFQMKVIPYEQQKLTENGDVQ